MRVHTSAFKEEIAKNGRQIDARVYAYGNFNLITEASDSLLTENNLQLIAEQINYDDKTLIDSELIYNMHILKHGNLLQSLMKQVNLELKYDLNVGNALNVQFGVLVGNSYEYLDYGTYIIYSKEYNANNETLNYVCYDKMLYSMIKYKPLNITYPCTIREYISAIADRLGLEFANSSDTFTNYNQPIAKELFENQNISYRDVLDKLSEIVAGNILINDDDELEIKYATTTNDTIDETNLKDINVNFGETFGPINKVSIQETDGGYEYPAEDSASIQTSGLTQINIVDNEFAFNGYTETIAQAILTQLNGLTYSINDFTTTGVCYYDFMDLFNVSIGENTYPCLLLNNEINIEQGLTETIFMQKEKNSQTKENEYVEPIMSNKEVQFKINQQEGKIEARVEKDGIISAINQSAEEIQINANKIKLEGYTTINDGFSVDLEGNATMHNATINGGNVVLTDSGGTPSEFSKIIINSTSGETYYGSGGFYILNNSDDSVSAQLLCLTGRVSDPYIGIVNKDVLSISNTVRNKTTGVRLMADFEYNGLQITEIDSSYNIKKNINITINGINASDENTNVGGWCYFEYELYNNTSGSNGTITLSDSAANFEYLEIISL